VSNPTRKVSFELYERTFAFIDTKLSLEEFEIVVTTGQSLLQSIPNEPSEQDSRIRCMIAIADALSGLDELAESLEYYNQARIAAEKSNALEKALLMSLYFKIERVLDRIAQSRVPVEISEETIRFLVNGPKKAAPTREVVARPTKAEIDALWKQALAESPNVVRKPHFIADPQAWLRWFLAVICTQQVENILIKLSCMFALMVIGSMAASAMHGLFLGKTTEDVKILDKYDGQKKLRFDSPTSKTKLDLEKGNKASLTIRDGRKYKGPVVTYDGSPIGALMTMFASNFGPIITFRYEHSTMVGPNGLTFHDERSPESNMDERIDELGISIQSYIDKNGEYPDKASDSLIYFDPFSGHGKSVFQYQEPNGSSVQDSLKKLDPKPQLSILWFTHPNSQNHSFELIFYKVNEPSVEYRANDGWHLLNGLGSLRLPRVGEQLTFIVCSTTMDPITHFFCEGNRFRLVLIILGVIVATLSAVIIIRRKSINLDAVKEKFERELDEKYGPRPGSHRNLGA